MNLLLPALLFAPLAGLLIGFSFNNRQEGPIFWATVLSGGINWLLLALLTSGWIGGDFEPLHFDGPALYRSDETEFTIRFYLDGYSLVYLWVATFLHLIISIFSRSYVHREKGYKRFFNNLKFFYLGLLVVLLAGNFETLFIGWEILGVTSFFLIGFYRERYLPVKNALKVVSLYRVADVAILLGIWAGHHYFGHSITFAEMHELSAAEGHVLNPVFYEFFLPGIFLLAALVKSAQFPFSSWLPRAMEGPTTSSAIFYGALSVHIGVYLLIRTSPLWADQLFFQVLIGAIGLITAIMATVTARVQSSVKTQIAYSSVAQIGLMFIEVALGWYGLAVVHFAGNALLRSYQLLVSPSVLSYRIHDQFFHFEPSAPQGTAGLWNRLKLSFYMLGIKEFNLDNFMFRYLWMPLKRAGRLFTFWHHRETFLLALPPFLLGLYALNRPETVPSWLAGFLSEGFALFALIFILKAFVERKSALTAWVLIVINQLYQLLAFGFNEQIDSTQVGIYLSGIVVSTFIGMWVIRSLRKDGENVSLDDFHGHAYEHPRLAFVFILACLGLAGFPITPTFIGEDLMLGHIRAHQLPLLLLIVLNLILDGLVIFRIYSRLFLGKHRRGWHEVAYRSS